MLFATVSLGLDENESTKQNLDVYRGEFEKHFLQATQVYYSQESDAFVAENSVVDYMKKAETRLKEEEDRVELYLHQSTRAKLIGACETVLVRGHAPMLWDEFQTLLDADKKEDLFRTYSLLFRIPEGLEPLREKFEINVKKAGQEAVAKVVGTGSESVVSSGVSRIEGTPMLTRSIARILFNMSPHYSMCTHAAMLSFSPPSAAKPASLLPSTKHAVTS